MIWCSSMENLPRDTPFDAIVVPWDEKITHFTFTFPMAYGHRK